MLPVNKVGSAHTQIKKFLNFVGKPYNYVFEIKLLESLILL